MLQLCGKLFAKMKAELVLSVTERCVKPSRDRGSVSFSLIYFEVIIFNIYTF